MKKIYEHMTSQSSDVKGYYAFFIALFVTLIIGIVWASTISSRFTDRTIERTTQSDSWNDFMKHTQENLGSVIESVRKENILPTQQIQELDFSLGSSEKRSEETNATPATSSSVGKAVASSTMPRTILIGTTTSNN